MKIERCPACKGWFQINLNHWQAHNDPNVRTSYRVQCYCGYSARLCYSKDEAITAHNAHCELVRWGKTAKRLEEVLDLEHAVDSMDAPAWVELIASEIKRDRCLAKAAKELAEKPPYKTITSDSTDGYDVSEQRAWNDGAWWVLNHLKEAMEENDGLVCDQCGRKATAVFDVGDICPCGGSFVKEEKR